MSYHFVAEKVGGQNLLHLQERLMRYELVEFFPVEVDEHVLTLGISIPFKAIEEPSIDVELVSLMIYLIVEKEFEVIDLFTGDQIRADDIPNIVNRVFG